MDEGFRRAEYVCEVTTATTGDDALRVLDDRKEQGFDLVILDLSIGATAGIEILHRLDEHGVPVVIFTSSTGDQVVDSAYQLGADGFFTKPAAPRKFITLVETIGETIYEKGQTPRGKIRRID